MKMPNVCTVGHREDRGPWVSHAPWKPSHSVQMWLAVMALALALQCFGELGGSILFENCVALSILYYGGNLKHPSLERTSTCLGEWVAS